MEEHDKDTAIAINKLAVKLVLLAGVSLLIAAAAAFVGQTVPEALNLAKMLLLLFLALLIAAVFLSMSAVVYGSHDR